MAIIKTKKENVVGEDAVLREFAIDVSIVGGVIESHCDGCITYEMPDETLDIETATFVSSVDNTEITDYFIKRWVEVTDIDAEIPVGFPNSVDEEGNQKKWGDVLGKYTLKIGDNFYPEVGYVFTGNPKGLTLDEFQNISVDLLTATEVNALKPVQEIEE